MTDELPQARAIDLTIVVPCKNERKHVGDTLDTIVQALAEVACSYEILVVDDGSTDGTSETVQQYVAAHPGAPVILRRNPVNRGLSRSFVDAAFAGRGKYLRLVCGDNVEPKETLVAILSQMGKADIVAPYHKSSPGSPLRIALSRTYTFLVNWFSGHRLHYYNGNPLFLREQVLRWHSYAFGFGYLADTVTRLLDEGATCIEVPIEAIRREKSGIGSYLSPRNLVSTAHTLYEILRRRLNRWVFEGGS
jgi:glycosyltransferase involved in cell wall biosynthesis